MSTREFSMMVCGIIVALLLLGGVTQAVDLDIDLDSDGVDVDVGTLDLGDVQTALTTALATVSGACYPDANDCYQDKLALFSIVTDIDDVCGTFKDILSCIVDHPACEVYIEALTQAVEEALERQGVNCNLASTSSRASAGACVDTLTLAISLLGVAYILRRFAM